MPAKKSVNLEKSLAELEKLVEEMEQGKQIGRASCRERV